MNVRLVTILAGVGALTLAAAPTATAEPRPGLDGTDEYPITQGNYTTTDDFYWVFFQTPDGWHCGIGPNGGPVGCDVVPLDAPAGTDQTVVNSWGPAEYRQSDTTTFTRDVDVLPAGQRLVNMGASCAVSHQGTVTCRTYGQHGFTISSVYGELW